MPAIPRSRSILFTWAVYGTVAGCLFALVYGRLVFPGASLSDLAFFIVGWFGLPAGLACGLVGGTVHGLVGSRKGAWLGGLAMAAVTPGFLAWLLDACPRLTWKMSLGPSIPWIVAPMAIMLALGGWLAAGETGASRNTPRSWKEHLYRTVPVLLVATLIVIFEATRFTGLQFLLVPGD